MNRGEPIGMTTCHPRAARRRRVIEAVAFLLVLSISLLVRVRYAVGDPSYDEL